MNNLPKVSIVGRPNVGKSSLFNAIIGSKKAIISNIPGTTRDSVSDIVNPKDKIPYLLVDTAGVIKLEKKDIKEQELEDKIQEQVKYAIDNSDIIIFVVDIQETNILKTDIEASNIIRKSNKPYIFIANKADNTELESNTHNFYELGLGEPFPISVSHRKNIRDLNKLIQKKLVETGFENSDENQDEENEAEIIKIALLGTPNVGKSALFNAICGEEKAVVSDIAGTTRDSTDTYFEKDNNKYLIIDTAGLRRRGKIEKGIEKYSVLRTEQSIERSDVCLLVIDAIKGVAKQDMHVAEYILDQKKSLVLVVNKWDLIKSKNDYPDELKMARMPSNDLMEQYIAYLRFKFPFLPWASVIFVSAKTGENIDFIFKQVGEAYASRKIRLETSKLNRFIERIVAEHKPTGSGSFVPRISYATQVSINPPHIVLFVNKKDFFHFSYPRYIENKLREKFHFAGTPIVLELRDKKKTEYNSKVKVKREKVKGSKKLNLEFKN